MKRNYDSLVRQGAFRNFGHLLTRLSSEKVIPRPGSVERVLCQRALQHTHGRHAVGLSSVENRLKTIKTKTRKVYRK